VSSASSDRDALRQQYADGSNLATRASLYQWQEPRHDLVATVVAQLRPGDGPVVDVGCGRGQYLEAARRTGLTAIGVDLSPGMAVDLVGDAAALPLPDASVGAALALHMLYHLPDPADGLRELARVVRPGGTIVVLTNGLDHLQPYRDLVSEAAGVDDGIGWPGRTFALEHRDLVESVLGPVELVDLQAAVTLDAVQPLVAYAESSRHFYEAQTERPWPEVIARFEDLACERMARDGTIVLPTHSGIFVKRVSR
jgi:SAM-dependent methyltransferase